jgi:DNA-binding transcriptional regulator of glucitol operon
MLWNIVIIAGIVWIILSVFNFIQSVQIRNIYKLLEPCGKIYFGRDAGFLRTRYIAFASVNPDGTVQNAKMLKTSRIVTLPNIQSLDHLISKNLLSLEPAAVNLDRRSEMAVQNLIANFKKYGKQAKK